MRFKLVPLVAVLRWIQAEDGIENEMKIIQWP